MRRELLTPHLTDSGESRAAPAGLRSLVPPRNSLRRRILLFYGGFSFVGLAIVIFWFYCFFQVLGGDRTEACQQELLLKMGDALILLAVSLFIAGGILAHLFVRRLTANLEDLAAHLNHLPGLPPAERPFHCTAKDETGLVCRALNRLLRELEGERNELLRAKNRAEAANEAKRHLLANVSHELRTPLHGILGLTQLCRETEGDGEQQARLAGIHEAAKSLLLRINDLLAIGNIEAAPSEAEQSGFSLRCLLASIGGEFGPQASAKGLELHLDVPAEIPDLLTGDGERLRLILGHLLDNAVKFSQRGIVTLGVALSTDGGEELRLRFYVRDAGIGIPSEQRERIFRPFEQGEQTSTRNFCGIGAGLSVCMQLLALFDTSLEVESSSGGGSTFSFLLSCAVQAPVASPSPLPATELHGRTVLIAVRSTAAARQLSAYLERLRMAPVVAIDPDRPEAALAGGKADIILLDGAGEMVRRLRRSCGEEPLLVLVAAGGAPENTADIDGYFEGTPSEAVFAEYIACLLARGRGTGASPRRPLTLYQVEELRYRLSILVAEDSEINRRVLSTILLRHGHRVWQATNGREALALWRDRPIDLVFMDVRMPELDGLEATRLIRAGEKTEGKRPTPVVAVTAGVLPEEKAACLAAGMDGYLLKPFDLVELRVLLAEAVQNKMSWAATPGHGVAAERNA